MDYWKTGFSKSYGFVEYFNHNVVDKLLEEPQEHKLDGCVIHVIMDLEETFDRAAKHLQTLTAELSSKELLQFYGLYKQATIGPCDTPKPNWYQTQAKYKWDAWKSLGDMSRNIAMDSYVRLLTEISPSWEEEAKTESHDWVKEGNDQKVQEILIKNPEYVGALDETKLLPIHWAADRGHVAVMACLVKYGTDINTQDPDGQTPLHYAASCGHYEAVKYLLSIGAQSIEDNDGMTPKDIADEQIISIL
ncbi:hypothetical protein KM043_011320 [Ampulex compressa]|nr:hypothetical protein KM043_011320 [Ampulex compressa]